MKRDPSEQLGLFCLGVCVVLGLALLAACGLVVWAFFSGGGE